MKKLKFSVFIKLAEKAAEGEKDKEEKKRYLLRKLSFRPSVDELKSRKVNS